MSDDLKTRIAVFVEKECNLEASIPALFLKAIALLYDCLARIEKLEWENKLFRDRLKELDTCHPDYGVSLEAAKKRIVELERESVRLGLVAGNECREHTANENQLKADLEAAEAALKEVRRFTGEAMSDASKDEIILCGCGWTGTREDWHTHNKTDSRHAAGLLNAELEAAKNRIEELERENRHHKAEDWARLKADLEAAEAAILDHLREGPHCVFCENDLSDWKHAEDCIYVRLKKAKEKR